MSEQADQKLKTSEDAGFGVEKKSVVDKGKLRRETIETVTKGVLDRIKEAGSGVLDFFKKTKQELDQHLVEDGLKIEPNSLSEKAKQDLANTRQQVDEEALKVKEEQNKAEVAIQQVLGEVQASIVSETVPDGIKAVAEATPEPPLVSEVELVSEVQPVVELVPEKPPEVELEQEKVDEASKKAFNEVLDKEKSIEEAMAVGEEAGATKKKEISAEHPEQEPVVAGIDFPAAGEKLLIEEILEKRKIEEEKVKLGPATWHNKEVNQPIIVTGVKGWGVDGKLYVSIEGSSTGVPFDEIIYKSADELTTEAIAKDKENELRTKEKIEKESGTAEKTVSVKKEEKIGDAKEVEFKKILKELEASVLPDLKIIWQEAPAIEGEEQSKVMGAYLDKKSKQKIAEFLAKLELPAEVKKEIKNNVIDSLEDRFTRSIKTHAQLEAAKLWKYHKKKVLVYGGAAVAIGVSINSLRMLTGGMVGAMGGVGRVLASGVMGYGIGALRGKIMEKLQPILDKVTKDKASASVWERASKEKAAQILNDPTVVKAVTKQIIRELLANIFNTIPDGNKEAETVQQLAEKDPAVQEGLNKEQTKILSKQLSAINALGRNTGKRLADFMQLVEKKPRLSQASRGGLIGSAYGTSISGSTELARVLELGSEATYAVPLLAGAVIGAKLYGEPIEKYWKRQRIEKYYSDIKTKIGSDQKDIIYLSALVESGLLSSDPILETQARKAIADAALEGVTVNSAEVNSEMDRLEKSLKKEAKTEKTVSKILGFVFGTATGVIGSELGRLFHEQVAHSSQKTGIGIVETQTTTKTTPPPAELLFGQKKAGAPVEFTVGKGKEAIYLDRGLRRVVADLYKPEGKTFAATDAAKIENTLANLRELAQGHEVAGLKSADFRDIMSWDGKTFKVLDQAAFENKVHELLGHANKMVTPEADAYGYTAKNQSFYEQKFGKQMEVEDFSKNELVQAAESRLSAAAKAGIESMPGAESKIEDYTWAHGKNYHSVTEVVSQYAPKFPGSKELHLYAVDADGDKAPDFYVLGDTDDVVEVYTKGATEPMEDFVTRVSQGHQELVLEIQAIDKALGKQALDFNTIDKAHLATVLALEQKGGTLTTESQKLLQETIAKLGSEEISSYLRDQELGSYLKSHLAELGKEELHKLFVEGNKLRSAGWQSIDYGMLQSLLESGRSTDGYLLNTNLTSPLTGKAIEIPFTTKEMFNKEVIGQAYSKALTLYNKELIEINSLKSQFEEGKNLGAFKNLPVGTIEKILKMDANSSLDQWKTQFGGGNKNITIDKLFKEINFRTGGKLGSGTASGTVADNLERAILNRSAPPKPLAWGDKIKEAEELIKQAEMMEERLQAKELIKKADKLLEKK